MKSYRHRTRFSRWRLLAYTSGLLVLLFLALILAVRSGVQAQPGPTARVVKDVLGQQQITVAIAGENLVNLGGFEFDLDVNPAVAKMQGAEAGDFLGSTGRTVGTLGPIIGAQGETIGFGAYSYDTTGSNIPGPSGNGTLAWVTMEVVSDGVSPLTLHNPIFADVQAVVQQVTTVSAALQVRSHHVAWNFMTPCVDTSSLTVTETLESITGDYTRVMGEEGTYVVGLPDIFQTLDSLRPGRGYFVYVTASTPVTFTQVMPPYDPHTPMALGLGWRWIGYCLETSLPVTMALESIDGLYDRVIGEYGTYVVGLPDQFQTLHEMRQGEGYQIRMLSEGTLQYPTSVPRVPAKVAAPAPSGACASVQNTPYITLVYGEVTVAGAPAPAGTVVEAVTPRGEVAGCFAVTHPGYFGVMQVYGEDAEGGIPGFRAAEPIQWRVNGQMASGSQSVTWSGQGDLYQVNISLGAPTGGAPSIFVPLVVNGK